MPTDTVITIPSSPTDTDHTTIDSFSTATDLTMDTFIRSSDVYDCSTPRCTSPTPSFLTYSERTRYTFTDLTMDSSFITDSTIANLTCSTLSSTTSDTDSLSVPTDNVTMLLLSTHSHDPC